MVILLGNVKANRLVNMLLLLFMVMLLLHKLFMVMNVEFAIFVYSNDCVALSLHTHNYRLICHSAQKLMATTHFSHLVHENLAADRMF